MSLSVRDLEAGYGKKRVLHGISLDIGEREVVAVIGHNGAGKSTLLKAIFGLLPDTTGTIQWGDAPIRGRRPTDILRAGIVYCPEGAQVFRRLSVRENLELGSFAVRNDAAVKRSLAKVLDLFPILAERAAMKAGQLSGGERQMLAIGMGLVAQPRLAMLDEPSGGLAPRLVASLMDTIRTIVSEFDTAVLLVEQNVTAGFRIADRAYVLANGAVADTGTPAELLRDGRLHKGFFGTA